MLRGGTPATIALVRGHDDDHLRTDERLRLRRLANELIVADGPDDGVTLLERMLAADAPPELLVVDLDEEDADELLADATIDPATVVLVLGDVDGVDLRPDATIVRLARPVQLQDLTRALDALGRFSFEVELLERPHRYELRCWICQPEVPAVAPATVIDLVEPTVPDVGVEGRHVEV